jgi:hypothetical protein
MSKSTAPRKNPNKVQEFEAFIKIIKKGDYTTWLQVAEALDVDQDTISAWKKHPRAQEALEAGIAHALKEMKKVGAKDWRMWHEVLKMLGVNTPTKLDLKNSRDPIDEILAAYGIKKAEGKDDGQTDEAVSGPPES